MSTKFFKNNIDGVHFPLFKMYYICNTTHPSHRHFVGLCREVHHMVWRNQYLELQEWENCIKSNKTIILAIITLVPKKNTGGYKEHVILFTSCTFGKFVIIIDWI